MGYCAENNTSRPVHDLEQILVKVVGVLGLAKNQITMNPSDKKKRAHWTNKHFFKMKKETSTSQ